MVNKTDLFSNERELKNIIILLLLFIILAFNLPTSVMILKILVFFKFHFTVMCDATAEDTQAGSETEFIFLIIKSIL